MSNNSYPWVIMRVRDDVHEISSIVQNLSKYVLTYGTSPLLRYALPILHLFFHPRTCYTHFGSFCTCPRAQHCKCSDWIVTIRFTSWYILGCLVIVSSHLDRVPGRPLVGEGAHMATAPHGHPRTTCSCRGSTPPRGPESKLKLLSSITLGEGRYARLPS